MKHIYLSIILLFCFKLQIYSQTTIKMKAKNGVYTLPCKINGLGLEFIFDTGASSVSLSLTEAIFMLKNGYLSKDDYLGTEYYRIANGEILEGYEFNLKTIEIGGLVIKNIKATVTNNSVAPLLLGQSALSKLGEYKFNYTDNTLIILKGNNLNRNKSVCKSGDCKNGKGEFLYENGDTYIGDFLNNEPSGFGVYKFLEGGRYEGEFKNGLFNGLGKYVSQTNDVYKGTFKDNMLSGFVEISFSNGEYYEGDYSNGKRNGNGITYKDGIVEIGVYKDDKLINNFCSSTSCKDYETSIKVGIFLNKIGKKEEAKEYLKKGVIIHKLTDNIIWDLEYTNYKNFLNQVKNQTKNNKLTQAINLSIDGNYEDADVKYKLLYTKLPKDSSIDSRISKAQILTLIGLNLYFNSEKGLAACGFWLGKSEMIRSTDKIIIGNEFEIFNQYYLGRNNVNNEFYVESIIFFDNLINKYNYSDYLVLYYRALSKIALNNIQDARIDLIKSKEMGNKRADHILELLDE